MLGISLNESSITNKSDSGGGNMEPITLDVLFDFSRFGLSTSLVNPPSMWAIIAIIRILFVIEQARWQV
jgi:hypothetical protein